MKDINHTNVILIKQAIDNLIRNAAPEQLSGVKRITAGCYTNKDGEAHAHASATITTRIYGSASQSELPSEKY